MRIVWGILIALLVNINVGHAGSDDVKEPKQENWQFDGMFGSFDKNSVQRGLKVYKEVCAACHSLKRVSFRNLEDIGFSKAQVKSFAAEYEVERGPNQEGEMYSDKAKPHDYFPDPYPNEQAARAANNNAYPVDLSLIVKARIDGANYVYSLLTGFGEAPEGFVVNENMYYNPYFAAGGSQLSMTPPLHTDEQVEYDDGTKATIDQMAMDVVNFLQWAAEPEMEQRKSLGVKTLLFVLIFTILFYFAKKRVWKKVK